LAGSLTPEQVATYRREGYLSPLRAMSAAQAADLRVRTEAVRGRYGEEAHNALRRKPHLLFPFLYDLVLQPAILDAVESLIGPDILCWSASFFWKPAGDPGFVSWHQDSTYWGLEPPDDILTAWVALTPSRRENGCMRVAPGTHAVGQMTHRDTFEADNMLTRGQELAVTVAEADAVDLVLEPGEMSLHHVRIAHGSEPNRSTVPRIGFAIRYIPTTVRQRGERPTATLARGVDRYRYFEHEPRPAADWQADAVAAYKADLARVDAVLYDGAAQRRAG